MGTAVAIGADASQVKVVYVMGAGHSGSTILGIALGNCADMFYAGEVDEWLVCSGIPPIGGAERTRFWGRVRSEVNDAEDLFGGRVNNCIERSSAVFRVDRWPARIHLRRKYRRVTRELYRAIARTGKARFVVDSSHFPLRARELMKLDGIELYLVFLVRDPQDVVASEIRSIKRHEVAERRFRTLTTNANLWLTHLLSVLVFLGQPRDRRVFVRHEDFLAEPEEVLRQVLDRFYQSATTPDFASLTTGYPLLGNKIMRAKELRLEGPGTPPARWSLITRLAQLPWTPVLAGLRPAASRASTESRP